MPILLAKFLREYPQVEIAIEAGSRQEIIRNLREGAVDLAIITLPVIGSEVVKTHLFEEPFVLIVPSSHPAASMKKFTPQILADETFLLYKPGTGTRKAIDRFFFRQKLTPKVPVVVNDSNVILELVARGLGMSMLPAYSLPLDKPAGVKAFPLKGLKRSLGIAYLKAQMLRPAALAFIQATRGYFHDANIAARKSR